MITVKTTVSLRVLSTTPSPLWSGGVEGGGGGRGEREREKESIGLRVCARAWGMCTCERRKFDIANMREG